MEPLYQYWQHQIHDPLTEGWPTASCPTEGVPFLPARGLQKRMRLRIGRAKDEGEIVDDGQKDGEDDGREAGEGVLVIFLRMAAVPPNHPKNHTKEWILH